MHVCYDNSFIFLHVPRTGGSSIRDTLSQSCELVAHIGDHEDGEYLYDTVGKASSVWKNYVKFGFVRNPWDRLVSSFFYLSAGGSNFVDKRVANVYLDKHKGDFGSFVRNIEQWFDGSVSSSTYKHGKSPHLRPQVKFLCKSDGELLVDFIGRYEKLEDDYAYLCDILVLEDKTLLHENRSEHLPYKEYYDDETREIVADYYREDINTFDYSF